MEKYNSRSHFPLAANRFEESFQEGCSYYKSATEIKPLTMPWTKVVELIRESKTLASMCNVMREAYLQHGKRSDAYKTPKRHLPAITPCAVHEGGRGYDYFRYATGKVQVDLDEVEDPTKLAEMIRLVDADPHTFLRYITPSGHGLRIIVTAETDHCDTLNYYNAWLQVNEYYSSLTDCPYDKSTKDITHLSFLSHDPTAYFNLEADPFTIVDAEMLKPEAPKPPRGGEAPKPPKGGVVTPIEIVQRILSASGQIYAEGNRNNYVHREIFLLCKLGLPEEETLRYVLAEHPGFEEREMPAHVHRVYSMPGLFNSWEERKVKHCGWMKKPQCGFDSGSNASGTAERRTKPQNQAPQNQAPQPPEGGENPQPPEGGKGGGPGRPSTKAPVQSIIDWLLEEYNLPPVDTDVPDGDSHKRRIALPDSGLRWNCITHKVEVFDVEEQRMVDLSNRQRKSLWVQCSVALGKKVSQQDFNDVVESYIVPLFNPFQAYFQSLKPWDGTTDHIARLAARIKLAPQPPEGGEAPQPPKGGVQVVPPLGSQGAPFFERCFRKWFVGMIASWLDPNVVNELVLVLIGKQGRYKSKFFQFLLPPELNRYFLSKTNATRMNKDEKLALSEFALISMEEIDSMRDSELNQLKALVTTQVITERAAYERAKDNYIHIASFCATGNKKQFLTDLTGNRRWLPFEVESILSPFDNPIDYEGLYAQGYALLQQGFQYWMTTEEGEELALHQRDFETPSVELDGIFKYFRQPIPQEGGLPDPKQQWMSCSEIASICGVNVRGAEFQQFVNRISLQLNKLGFQRYRKRFREEVDGKKVTHDVTGFYVVLKDADEQSYDNETPAWRMK